MRKNKPGRYRLLQVVCVLLLPLIMVLSLQTGAAGESAEIKCSYKVNKPVRMSKVIQMSKKELGYFRNEIYARYGRTFKTPEYRAFFEAQPWYKVNSKFSDSMLTAIDKENVRIILGIERPSKQDSELTKYVITKKWKECVISNHKMTIIFSQNGRCLINGDFRFLPYVQDKGTVKGRWKVFDQLIYIWFDLESIAYGSETYVGVSTLKVKEISDKLSFEQI